MTLVAPNFETSDLWVRELNPRFLLDTRLGSSQWLLTYSWGVRHAVSMLTKPDDRKTFVAIANILAFSEMQRWGIWRIHPISWQDLANLSELGYEVNSPSPKNTQKMDLSSKD